MKIVFTGLPFFSKKLVDELSKFDSKNNYYFFNTYYSKIDQIKFILNIINADLVISFNGVTSKSKALDWAILLKKKILMQWHGTDVLLALERTKSKSRLDKYINHSVSFTDTIWLQEELKSININAQILTFKHLSISEKSNSKFKSKDAVSYIAKGKEEFYGINQLLKLADAFPTTGFHIVGTNGSGFTNKNNVKFYGWLPQQDFKKLRTIHPIFIRLTKHDGCSLSVIEALAEGNEVLWNYPHPKCHLLSSKEDIIQLFSDIQTKVEKHNFKPNALNIQWIRENMNQEIVLRTFINKIEKIAKK